MKDEYARFDPRAYWAAVNNEVIDYSNYEKQVRERQEAILDALAAGPKTAKELAEMTNIRRQAIFSNVKFLRRKGCEIKGERTNYGTLYTLISRPNVLPRLRGCNRT